MRMTKAIAIALTTLSTFLVGSATAFAQQPIQLGFIPVMGVAQVFVAQGEGWLDKAGLKLNTTTFESGPNMIQALQSGTLNVYAGGLAPLLVARSKGIDVRIVAATVVEEMGVAASAAFAPQIDPKNIAASFKAFREKNGRPVKLATQPLGSGPNTALQYWLWEVVKADKADVQIVEMGIDATQRAIATGAVEGGSIREPALTIIRKQNPAVKLIATGRDMFPNFPGVVIAVLGSYADQHPEQVTALVRSIIRATNLLKEKPEQAVPYVGAAFGKGLVPDDILLEALKSPQTQFTSDPHRIEEPVKRLQEYQVKIGVLQKAEPLDGLFAFDVYDRAAASN
jgi:NitT/TauT family transport system substrate-binding protein